MADIRVTCQCCGFVALLRPAQVVLVTDSVETPGAYLFLCPVCERLTVRFADAAEVRLLVAAGVRAGGAEGQATDVRPSARHVAGPPFTPDDVLDLHLLLASDDWLSRLAGLVRPSLSAPRPEEEPR